MGFEGIYFSFTGQPASDLHRVKTNIRPNIQKDSVWCHKTQ